MAWFLYVIGVALLCVAALVSGSIVMACVIAGIGVLLAALIKAPYHPGQHL